MALKLVLEIELSRPINSKVAFDNVATQKVLQKNYFEIIKNDK